ncbi:hypothetical protein EDC04DRAFT_2614364 [Pisolithus marmoratus]|nr:hypothetical protein EDC04DRAFT_2614364 [Pisolithus marmoratus]
MSTAISPEQWLFRQSSPIDKDRVTHVIISHIPTVAAVQRDMTPLILQRFAPPIPSIPQRSISTTGTRQQIHVSPLGDLMCCETDIGATHSSSEASQPTNGHTPLLTVSPRKLNKFHDSMGAFHWFRSEGHDPLSFPPSHIKDVAEGDFFFYWVKSVGKCQMWIWKSVGAVSTWVPVREGEQFMGRDGTMRYLVITDGHQPSLVQAVTWERRYKQRQALATLS